MVVLLRLVVIVLVVFLFVLSACSCLVSSDSGGVFVGTVAAVLVDGDSHMILKGSSRDTIPAGATGPGSSILVVGRRRQFVRGGGRLLFRGAVLHCASGSLLLVVVRCSL